MLPNNSLNQCWLFSQLDMYKHISCKPGEAGQEWYMNLLCKLEINMYFVLLVTEMKIYLLTYSVKFY